MHVKVRQSEVFLLNLGLRDSFDFLVFRNCLPGKYVHSWFGFLAFASVDYLDWSIKPDFALSQSVCLWLRGDV